MRAKLINLIFMLITEDFAASLLPDFGGSTSILAFSKTCIDCFLMILLRESCLQFRQAKFFPIDKRH